MIEKRKNRGRRTYDRKGYWTKKNSYDLVYGILTGLVVSILFFCLFYIYKKWL